MSIHRFRNRDERGSTGGLMPSTVIPPTSSISTEGPSASNSCGSTLTLTPNSRARLSSSKSARPSKSSRATTTRSARCWATIALKLGIAAASSAGIAIGALAARRGSGIRPTDFAPWRPFAFSFLARAEISLPSPSSTTRSGPRSGDREPSSERSQGGDRDDREQGEQRQGAEPDAAHGQEAVAGEQQQASDDHRVEYPWQVVHGLVADSLQVPVIEAIRLEDADPQRQHHQAPGELARVVRDHAAAREPSQ